MTIPLPRHKRRRPSDVGSQDREDPKRQTIVYVNDQGEIGGAEISCLDDIAEHWHLGHRVVLICPPNSTMAARAIMKGIPTVGIPFSPVLGTKRYLGRARSAFSLLASIKRLRRCLQCERASVTVGNSAKSAILTGIAAQLVHPKPLVIAINYEDFYFGSYFARNVYYRLLRSLVTRLADYVVVHTHQRHRQLGAFISNERSVFARMPMNLQPYLQPSDPNLRSELSLPESACIFGMVGQMISWKGQREFLVAAGKVAEEQRDAHFVLIGDAKIGGDTTYIDRLRELCHNLGIENQVSFLGWRDNIPEIMAALDVFVLPSHHEPFGRVVIEAMAAGKAVIATGVGGPLELIDTERTGILVPPSDPMALAAAMRRLIASPEERLRLGSNARQWIATDFGINRPVSLSMAGICARIIAGSGHWGDE